MWKSWGQRGPAPGVSYQQQSWKDAEYPRLDWSPKPRRNHANRKTKFKHDPYTVCLACGGWEFDKMRGAACKKCDKPFLCAGKDQPKEGSNDTNGGGADGNPHRLQQLVAQIKKDGAGGNIEEVFNLLSSTLGVDVQAALNPFMPTEAPTETQAAVWRSMDKARKAHGKAKAAVEQAQKDLEAKQAELEAAKTRVEATKKGET